FKNGSTGYRMFLGQRPRLQWMVRLESQRVDSVYKHSCVLGILTMRSAFPPTPAIILVLALFGAANPLEAQYLPTASGIRAPSASGPNKPTLFVESLNRPVEVQARVDSTPRSK